MQRLFAAAALASTLALALPGAPGAQETPIPATLAVTGQGVVRTAPDIATTRAGVETEGRTAAAALAANNELAGKIIATLKEAGVEARDIQTGNLVVEPRYADMSRATPGQPLQIVGYRVVNEVAVTIRDLEKMGAVLDSLVQAGANRINSIGFGLEDDSAAADEARKKAVADAKRVASVLAEAAGVKLVRVLSINDAGHFPPQPMPMMRMHAEAAMAVPVEAGETAVQATVSIVWEIAPAG